MFVSAGGCCWQVVQKSHRQTCWGVQGTFFCQNVWLKIEGLYNFRMIYCNSTRLFIMCTNKSSLCNSYSSCVSFKVACVIAIYHGYQSEWHVTSYSLLVLIKVTCVIDFSSCVWVTEHVWWAIHHVYQLLWYVLIKLFIICNN